MGFDNDILARLMPSGRRPPHQFSILTEDFEGEIEVESGAPAGVADVFTSRRPDQIVGEGAQAGDDVGVLADAGGVFGEGGVAHVVAAIFNAPMRANPFVPAFGWLVGGRGYPVDDLVGMRQSPVAGLRLKTVRFNRSTVLISGSQGVWRNHALAGKTVNSRVSQRLRPADLLVSEPIGFRAEAPSSSLRRRLG